MFLFFIAGFDTSSSAMTFALYELAQNPDIQDKLRKEIKEVLTRNHGEITYECIKEMTYLQQVLDGTTSPLIIGYFIKSAARRKICIALLVE